MQRRNFLQTLIGGLSVSTFAPLLSAKEKTKDKFLGFDTSECRLPRGTNPTTAAGELSDAVRRMLVELDARFTSIRSEWRQSSDREHGYFHVEIVRAVNPPPYWGCYYS